MTSKQYKSFTLLDMPVQIDTGPEPELEDGILFALVNRDGTGVAYTDNGEIIPYTLKSMRHPIYEGKGKNV